jgi:Na+/melibiose symporter-like transporter
MGTLTVKGTDVSMQAAFTSNQNMQFFVIAISVVVVLAIVLLYVRTRHRKARRERVRAKNIKKTKVCEKHLEPNDRFSFFLNKGNQNPDDRSF